MSILKLNNIIKKGNKIDSFTFSPVPLKYNFPEEEKNILNYWERIKAFDNSLKQSIGKKPFSFYDGPPFATGEPHYGHILAGTIKDVVTRYAHQTGHYVERRFGWDTHGLPVEFEIDNKFNIKSRNDVYKMGIKTYNDHCRNIVMRYSKEWRKTISRSGRWIDFDNDYKTMDINFMESVWWVFKTIYTKGLIYRGYKIMPFSCRLGTPLSNFEANLNYKDISDPSVFVAFPLIDDTKISLIAWTTTPWTLISNLSLCISLKIKYVKIRDLKTNSLWILAKSCLKNIYKNPKPNVDYEIVEMVDSKELIGKKYIPIFNYFVKKYESKEAFRVLCDNYVTELNGSGIVHQAPGFGEDDYRVCLKNKIIDKNEEVLCPINENGFFIDQVEDFKGLHIKESDKQIIKYLKKKNLIIKESQHYHSYPFCWRSDTPLIYKAVPCWFLNVTKIKTNLLKNNELTYWVPSYVKEKRFHNWLKDACDWAISRNRFFGTPLPVWTNEDFSEMVVIGSIEELKKLSGNDDITDLHREYIDKIKIPDKTGKGYLRRIDEVFDCWFESGSMPYGQIHYPFENVEKFKKTFPADFIAEGLDQTRGWFYTLMVISTALFNKPAFKNLICNGLVLAEDGKKMSKRLKNYPSPNLILDKFGADALRIYLINSPVVRAEFLKFSEKGVNEVIKNVLLLWFNTYRFFIENATRYEKKTNTKFIPNNNIYKETDNILDKWIIASLQTLIESVRNNMKLYKIYNVTPNLINFLNLLSLWYVRINRDRMKSIYGDFSCLQSLQTLYYSLFTLCQLFSPFTPFFTEMMYQNIKNCYKEKSNYFKDSIHYLEIPNVIREAKNEKIEISVNRMKRVIEMGRKARDNYCSRIKQPLNKLIVVNPNKGYLNDIKYMENYIKDDLNIENIEYYSNLKDYVNLSCKPEFKIIGHKYKGDTKKVINIIKKLDNNQICDLKSHGKIFIDDFNILSEDVSIEMKFNGDTTKYSTISGDGGLILLDMELNEDLLNKGISRELISRIQKYRKKIELNPNIQINIFYKIKDDTLLKAINDNIKYIKNKIKVPFHSSIYMPEYSVMIGREDSKINGMEYSVIICRPCVIFKNEIVDDKEGEEEIKNFVLSKQYSCLKNNLKKNNGELRIYYGNGGKSVLLKEGVDFYLNIEEMLAEKIIGE